MWEVIIVAIALALIAWLLSKAVFNVYFRAKETYVERLANKLKGLNNGKN